MKKLIALILICFILTLSACKPTSTSSYTWGDTSLGFEFYTDFNAKVTTDTAYHPKDDVVLDIYISAYDYEQGLEIHHLEETSDHYVAVIYLSNSSDLPFYYQDSKYKNLKSLQDVEGAKLVRKIYYGEMFNTDFGYHSEGGKINYDHKEKIYIPEEFFGEDNSSVYIHLLELTVYDNESGDGVSVNILDKNRIEINYEIIDDQVKLGYNR